MSRIRTGFRLMSIMMMVAFVQIMKACLLLGPLNPGVFFSHEKADEFARLSERLLIDVYRGSPQEYEIYSTSLNQTDRLPYDDEVRSFVRKHKVYSLKVNHDKKEVEWSFMGAYRVFADYTYCQRKNINLTDRAGTSVRPIYENWWYHGD